MSNDAENLSCIMGHLYVFLCKVCVQIFSVFEHWVACLIGLEEFFIQFPVEVLRPADAHTLSAVWSSPFNCPRGAFNFD